MKFPLVTILIICAALSPAVGKDYAVPSKWTDKQGNPIKQEGSPRWRLDALWPDDPTKASAYQPMVWKEKFWQPKEHTQGNWPRIEIGEEGALTLTTAGPWDDNPERKIPALVFVAPKTGRYYLRGKAHARVFQGDKPVQILVVKRYRSNASVLFKLEIGHEQTLDLPSDPISLTFDEELVLVPVQSTNNNAADLSLLDFKVSDEPAKR